MDHRIGPAWPCGLSLGCHAMRFSSRIFLLDHDDGLYRLPNTKFNQMLRDPTSYRLTRFAGTRVRMTDVAVELQNHQPVRVVRITFSFLTFDDGGYFDVAAFTRHQWARAELGFDLATAAPGSTGTVVDAETRFVAQGGLWKPSRKLQRQIDAAALGQVKCPRL
jgi:hypothetical protein